MVSPLSTAPWTHTSQRGNECCDVLERYAYTIQSLPKSCRSCQINKRRICKYGHLSPKTVITNPWKCLCVDFTGPYTLVGKDNLQIDFMALTMIDPASSWFEIAELPVVKQLRWQTVNGNKLLIADEIFDKTSECIKSVNKTWLCRYHGVFIWYTTTEVSLNYTSNTYVNHMVSGVSQPRLGIHKQTHIGMCTSSPRTNATHSWIRYGQIIYPQWHWCLPRQQGMGNLLYLSQGT